jgi:hypothetical protein
MRPPSLFRAAHRVCGAAIYDWTHLDENGSLASEFTLDGERVSVATAVHSLFGRS